MIVEKIVPTEKYFSQVQDQMSPTNNKTDLCYSLTIKSINAHLGQNRALLITLKITILCWERTTTFAKIVLSSLIS